MAGNLNVQQTSQSLLSVEAFRRPRLTPHPTPDASQETTLDHRALVSKDPSTFLNSDELRKAVERLDELARVVRQELQFSVDETSGRVVIKVIDIESKETIRQIPPEEILNLISRFKELNSGLVNTEA